MTAARTAPAAATPAYFLGPDGKPRDHDEAVPGGLSVGVPGNIRHARAGARAARPAALGAPVRSPRSASPATASRSRRACAGRSIRSRETGALTPCGRALFYEADGKPKPVGTIVRNPELAAFLERSRRAAPTLSTPARPPRRWSAPSARPRATRRSMTDGDLATYDAKERPAGLRHLSRLPDLRHGPALLGRDHGVRDPEAARAVRPARRWARTLRPPGI